MSGSWSGRALAIVVGVAVLVELEPLGQGLLAPVAFGQAANPEAPGEAKPVAQPAQTPGEQKPAASAPAPPSTAPAEPAAEPKAPAPGSRPPEPSPQAAEAAIENALLQNASAEFTEEALSVVMEYFGDLLSIDIAIDHTALNDMGVDVETPVSVSLANVPFGSALDLILEPHGLGWAVRGGVLRITTADEAANMLLTRLYDVADLVTYRDVDGAVWEDYDTLVGTITETVEPDTWDDAGGAGSIQGATFATARVLVVSQTYSVHQKLGKLLEDLRRLAGCRAAGGEPPLKKKPEPLPGLEAGLGGLPMGGFGSMGPMGGFAGAFFDVGRGTVVVVSQETAELKLGDKTLVPLPRGAKLPVLDVREGWVGVSVLVEGKETIGWVRRGDVEPLAPGEIPGLGIPGTQAVDGGGAGQPTTE